MFILRVSVFPPLALLLASLRCSILDTLDLFYPPYSLVLMSSNFNICSKMHHKHYYETISGTSDIITKHWEWTGNSYCMMTMSTFTFNT